LLLPVDSPHPTPSSGSSRRVTRMPSLTHRRGDRPRATRTLASRQRAPQALSSLHASRRPPVAHSHQGHGPQAQQTAAAAAPPQSNAIAAALPDSPATAPSPSSYDGRLSEVHDQLQAHVSDPLHIYPFVLDSILVQIRVYFPSIHVLSFSVHMDVSQESQKLLHRLHDHQLIDSCAAAVATLQLEWEFQACRRAESVDAVTRSATRRHSSYSSRAPGECVDLLLVNAVTNWISCSYYGVFCSNKVLNFLLLLLLQSTVWVAKNLHPRYSISSSLILCDGI